MGNCRRQMMERMRSLGIYRLAQGERSLVECELEGYLCVLEALEEQIAAVEQNLLPDRCSPKWLAEFERMLSIPVNLAIPIQSRRRIAQSKLAIGPNDYHREGLERALGALGIRAAVKEMPGEEKITVTAQEMADSSMTLDEAKRAFSALMPAHLEADFVTGGLNFEEFDALDRTFEQLDRLDKSWSELEMMGAEQWQEVQNV